MDIAGDRLNNFHFDEKAFELLFKDKFASLCAYCQYKFDLSPDQSKEVVHTAFIKLWEARSTLSPRLPVTSYLYKIITNNCLDIIKHDKIKDRYQSYIQTSFVDKAEPGFEEIDIKQLSAQINKAISELPEQMRKIFELSRHEGLKYAAIAEELNISVKTVETQMSRALARLRERLTEYLPLFFIFLLPWL